MSVNVILPNHESIVTTPLEMSSLCRVFPVTERVAAAAGKGIDLMEWFTLLYPCSTEMTHLVVRATDEFQATIPRAQLELAVLQLEVEGQPLTTNGPLRLYVPHGSSECLNVKRVYSLQFIADPELAPSASYGFKNEWTEIPVIRGRSTL